MTRLAGAAWMLGFAGLAWDEELYPGKTGKTGSWLWNYPGNTRAEPVVRNQVRARGAQMMQAMVAGYPNVEVITIGWRFPESWEELVQKEINGYTNANATSVSIDFWDGMASTPGYGAIRFMDSVFYKTSHLNRSTWDSSLTYNNNRLFAMFSRAFDNWAYAASRVQVAPFGVDQLRCHAVRSSTNADVRGRTARGISAVVHWRSLRQLQLRQLVGLRLHPVRARVEGCCGRGCRRHAGTDPQRRDEHAGRLRRCDRRVRSGRHGDSQRGMAYRNRQDRRGHDDLDGRRRRLPGRVPVEDGLERPDTGCDR